jgi:CBS domain-containing protein
MRSLTAKDIMSTPVIEVRWDASVPDIVATMRRHAISGVPVVDEFGLLCGIVTEANILEKEAGEGGLSELSYRRSGRRSPAFARQHGARADEIMVRDVITARADTPVREIARTMVRVGINRVPVMDGENVIGIVTRADILALFDRSPAELLAEARAVLRNDLLMDPDRFEILVVNSIVQIRGSVETAEDVRLIETFVAQIDGVSSVETSHLEVGEPLGRRT